MAHQFTDNFWDIQSFVKHLQSCLMKVSCARIDMHDVVDLITKRNVTPLPANQSPWLVKMLV